VQAVVLVGGEGTRLRPLTLSAPKQMLPIMGVAMLEGVLGHLALHGVDEAVLSLGYLPDRFLEAYPDGRCAGVRLRYAVEPTPLDTAGAVRFALQELELQGTFLVANGDVLTDLDVTALVGFHQRHGAEGTIALHPVEDPSRFGVVPTDEEGRVLAFVEKPPRDEAPTNLINAGTYVFEPSFTERVSLGERVSLERVTFPEMVADGSLFALADDHYWLDTGTPEAFLQAHQDILTGERSPHFVPHPVRGGNCLAPGSTVEVGAKVSGTMVDVGCRVSSGALVEDSVLLPGAVVEEGAIVIGSILGPDSLVGAGAVLRPTTVLGARARVAPHSEIIDGRIEA
jgi:mannose-1-phosphate guanylyltransferase